MRCNSVDEIPTDKNGYRYVYVCKCRHHPCNFTGEGIDNLTTCDGDGGQHNVCKKCHSLSTRKYKPSELDLESIPDNHRTVLEKQIQQCNILAPLKKKLD